MLLGDDHREQDNPALILLDLKLPQGRRARSAPPHPRRPADPASSRSRPHLQFSEAVHTVGLFWLLLNQQAAALLASVTGQDLDQGADGVFRIARRVAKDRIVSTVDPGARHGHKTSARGFDGYKGHVAIDPDAELITATAVTPGNAGDAAAAADLLAAELPAKPDEPGSSRPPPQTNRPPPLLLLLPLATPPGPNRVRPARRRPGSPRPGTRNSSPSTETRPTARAS